MLGGSHALAPRDPRAEAVKRVRYDDIGPCDHTRQSCADVGCEMPKECAEARHPKNKHGRCRCGAEAKREPSKARPTADRLAFLRGGFEAACARCDAMGEARPNVLLSTADLFAEIDGLREIVEGYEAARRGHVCGDRYKALASKTGKLTAEVLHLREVALAAKALVEALPKCEQRGCCNTATTDDIGVPWRLFCGKHAGTAELNYAASLRDLLLALEES